MISEILFIAGTIPFMFLGLAHIRLNLIDFKTNSKIVPVRNELTEMMKADRLKITGQTTVWKAWVGFNISHGMGAFFFGCIYLILAITDFTFLNSSIALMSLLFVVSLSYVILAVKYWFRIPTVGTSIGFGCFVLSLFF